MTTRYNESRNFVFRAPLQPSRLRKQRVSWFEVSLSRCRVIPAHHQQPVESHGCFHLSAGSSIPTRMNNTVAVAVDCLGKPLRLPHRIPRRHRGVERRSPSGALATNHRVDLLRPVSPSLPMSVSKRGSHRARLGDPAGADNRANGRVLRIGRVRRTPSAGAFRQCTAPCRSLCQHAAFCGGVVDVSRWAMALPPPVCAYGHA